MSAKETVDLMRRDSRERLGMSEMLMNLLLRLDSVRGVDPGVRDYRKTVIRKVIALQETLDAIVTVEESSAAETTGEETIEMVQVPMEEENPSDPCPAAQFEDNSPDLVEVATETDGTQVPQIQKELYTEKSPETSHENERNEAEGERMEEIERTESQTDSSANPEIPEEENEKQQLRTEEETRGEGKEKSKEMLERMMEENERMMEMMAQLFDRNELQTRLLSSLSQRVEQLEKAFVYDRLRRKKRRNAAATKLESPEGKKPGRG
ncbi:PREDICTED: BAG family molecular chaperone regulator 6-like [Tarenaya hassleriana]|uniref:BAG family molecular chaperone regulator 6-like n=1 Tax=Tarenaya hassleriana TaxID=28532 RepID=UPI00053C14F3|nr:PREDICTED: BAG family molecular chaperone regulator 6-like [Tarenaya hassleriana]